MSNPELKAKVEAKNPETVVYLPQEIEYLTGLKPEAIKNLHYMRKVFGGEFISKGKASEDMFNQQTKERLKAEGIFNPRPHLSKI